VGAGCFGGNGVGHADWASGAVVVAGAQAAGGVTGCRGDRERVEHAELCEVEHDVFLVGADEADEVVDDLGQPDGGEIAGAVFEQRADVIGSRFVPQIAAIGACS
jgi:hypothetical protein